MELSSWQGISASLKRIFVKGDVAEVIDTTDQLLDQAQYEQPLNSVKEYNDAYQNIWDAIDRLKDGILKIKSDEKYLCYPERCKSLAEAFAQRDRLHKLMMEKIAEQEQKLESAYDCLGLLRSTFFQESFLVPQVLDKLAVTYQGHTPSSAKPSRVLSSEVVQLGHLVNEAKGEMLLSRRYDSKRDVPYSDLLASVVNMAFHLEG